MNEFRIETESPLVELRTDKGFGSRASEWCRAAHKLLSAAISSDREINGCGEEVSLLLTNRQADHLAMGLGVLADRLRPVCPNPVVRDGLYRLEFAYGERRCSTPAIRIDFAAEVVDGAGKGLQVGETLSFSWSGWNATGGANEQKVRDYANALGVATNHLDHEEWLLRPFLAEIVDQKIVAISNGKSAFTHLPVAAETPRALAWDAETGWDFEHLTNVPWSRAA
jgi:hypothetical protein